MFSRLRGLHKYIGSRPSQKTSPKSVVWLPHYVTVTQVCGFVCVCQRLKLVFVQSRARSHVGATRVLSSHYFYFPDSVSLCRTTPLDTGRLISDAQLNGWACCSSSVVCRQWEASESTWNANHNLRLSTQTYQVDTDSRMKEDWWYTRQAKPSHRHQLKRNVG